MKVNYRGQKRECSFKDKLFVESIKLKLHIRRNVRRIKIVISKSDLIFYLMIIILWAIFAGVTTQIDKAISGVCKSFFETVWDLRNSLFSSVILAFAISSFNKIKDYKKAIRLQHYVYVDTMADFEGIINALSPSAIWLHFHPFYNDKCYEITEEYLKSEGIAIDISNNELLLAIDVIQNRIEYIEREIKAGNLKIRDEEMIILYISSAKKTCSRMILKNDNEEFWKLLREMYIIVEELRFIWRKDESDNSKIISKLAKYDKNDIYNQFYERMFLENISINTFEE